MTDEELKVIEAGKKRAEASDGFMMIDMKIGEDGSLNLHHAFDIREQYKSHPYINEGIFTAIIMMLLNKLIEECTESTAKVECLTQIENFIKMSKLDMGTSIRVNH